MSDFAKAIEMVIATHEGGFQKRVDDPGNWTPAGELRGTKFGISAHSFPDVDIEALTLNEAEELYRKIWGMFAALEDQRVLTKVLDLAVNMEWAGRGPAVVILQKAIAICGGHVEQDGIFGAQTAEEANKIDGQWLLDVICAQAKAHYKALEAAKPEMKAWFAAWNDRASWMPPGEEKSP
jgi:lysozyme family protein